MGAKIANVTVLIVVGIIIADLVTHQEGTKTLVDGTTKLWSTSVNGLLGKTA